jgi:large subunit ribosomal protein L17
MSKSNPTEIEQGIGSEVSHFVYRVPKENHDVMMQLNKQFVNIMRGYGATHLVLQLNNTEAPMEGITNISKTLSVNQDEETWLELIFYKDRRHQDEVDAKMRNDVNMEQLFKQSMDLITPGTTFIMGEFTRLGV